MSNINIRVPGLLTDVDTTARTKVGTPWLDESNQKKYMYVYNAGATSWVAGDPVGVFLTGTAVGNCSFTAATQLLIAEGGTDVTAIAGIGLSTVATTQYGWIQIAGYCTAVTTDGNVDASEGLYVADNGVVALPVTEPTHVGRFGTCVVADGATTTCTAYLDRTFWNVAS